MKKKDKKQEVKSEKKEVVFITKELKQSKISNEEYDKVKGFVFLVIIIGIFVGILFLVNGNLVTKDLKEDETTTTTTEVEYDSSLLTADSVFNVKDKNYYVLFVDETIKDEKEFAEEFISKFKGEETPIYKVNLGDLINKKYYDKNGTENIKPTSKDDLLLTRTTLIKFKKNKVVSFITDKNEIGKELTPEEK
ncbi:MAG: hypothetical protein IJS56_00035 [Bacilli bacterium]|nr:hypothetical protein [Bacilli bacterium]